MLFQKKQHGWEYPGKLTFIGNNSLTHIQPWTIVYGLSTNTMSKRNVTVRMKADYEYEATNAQGNIVQIDMYDAPNKKAQSPMDLLLSALGGCASVDAVLMMKKKRREIVDFFVELEGHRNEGIPAYYKVIHMKFTLISPDATNEEFAKVVALSVEKYCSVSSSLKSKISFSSEVRKS